MILLSENQKLNGFRSKRGSCLEGGIDGRRSASAAAADSPPIYRPFATLFAGFDSVAKLLLPARNKQILPSLPLIRLHQE
jgi:hypothetical protein